MGQRRTEVGSIKSIGSLRNVHFLTLGTIDLDSILTKLVVECVGHDFLLVTKGAGAVPVSTLQVLSVNESETCAQRTEMLRMHLFELSLTFWGSNVASMNQSVHVRSLAVQRQERLTLQLFLGGCARAAHERFALRQPSFANVQLS